MKRLLLSILLVSPSLMYGQMIRTVAGNGASDYDGDGGPAISAKTEFPTGIAAGKNGDYYIIDGSRCLVRKINGSGIITTVAGYSACLDDPGGVRSGDGEAANYGRLNRPSGLAVSAAGDLYIADEGNKRVRLVRSGVITTFAGTGATSGSLGDGGQASAANLDPIDVAVDAAGNLFLSDKLLGGVRRVDAVTGVITPIAGTGSTVSAGDNGPASAASMDPSGLTIDKHGNLYVVDGNNMVREINAATGIITTVAGSWATGTSGDGGPATAAKFQHISDVAVDTVGNLYIADMNNNVIRVVNTEGTISRYAGDYTGGYGGDGSVATSAMLLGPSAIAIDATGGLLIADLYNSRIRKAGGVFLAVPETTMAGAFAVYPNPATNRINITSDGERITTIRIADVIGKTVFEKAGYPNARVEEDISGLPNGVYLVTVNDRHVMKLVKN